MDDKSPIVPLEQDGATPMKEKKTLIGLSGLLMVAAALMFVGSSHYFNVMMDVRIVSELFSTPEYHYEALERTVIAFRVMVFMMIALAILQLVANMIFTAAVYSDEVDQILHYHVMHSVVTITAACCSWVFTLVILGISFPGDIWSNAPFFILFCVGIVHISINLKVFTIVQAQKYPPTNEKSENRNFPVVTAYVK